MGGFFVQTSVPLSAVSNMFGSHRLGLKNQAAVERIHQNAVVAYSSRGARVTPVALETIQALAGIVKVSPRGFEAVTEGQISSTVVLVETIALWQLMGEEQLTWGGDNNHWGRYVAFCTGLADGRGNWSEGTTVPSCGVAELTGQGLFAGVTLRPGKDLGYVAQNSVLINLLDSSGAPRPAVEVVETIRRLLTSNAA